jgi:hypothetical protein
MLLIFICMSVIAITGLTLSLRVKSKKIKIPETKEDLFIITDKVKNNIPEFTIDLNEKEFKKRMENGSLLANKSNTGKSVRDITGLYGMENYSPDKNFYIVAEDGWTENEKWKNGSIALVCGKKLLFKKKLQRPNEVHVSNGGISVCCDWLKSDALDGRFIILDTTGKIIFEKNTTANLGSAGISADSSIALFETYSSPTEDADSIFVIDVPNSTILNQFKRPVAYNGFTIDTEKERIVLNADGFNFEVNYKGTPINTKEYENEILEKGTILKKLRLCFLRSEEHRIGAEDFLMILQQALTDKESCYTYGEAILYRKAGECFESLGNIPMTIDNWQKAVQLNPKIGVLRKLNKYKSG